MSLDVFRSSWQVACYLEHSATWEIDDLNLGFGNMCREAWKNHSLNFLFHELRFEFKFKANRNKRTWIASAACMRNRVVRADVDSPTLA